MKAKYYKSADKELQANGELLTAAEPLRTYTEEFSDNQHLLIDAESQHQLSTVGSVGYLGVGDQSKITYYQMRGLGYSRELATALLGPANSRAREIQTLDQALDCLADPLTHDSVLAEGSADVCVICGEASNRHIARRSARMPSSGSRPPSGGQGEPDRLRDELLNLIALRR